MKSSTPWGMSLWLVEHPTPLRFLPGLTSTLSRDTVTDFFFPWQPLSGFSSLQSSLLEWPFQNRNLNSTLPVQPFSMYYHLWDKSHTFSFWWASRLCLAWVLPTSGNVFSFLSYPKEKILPHPERQIPQENHSCSYSPKSSLFFFSARVAFSYQNILPISNDVF